MVPYTASSSSSSRSRQRSLTQRTWKMTRRCGKRRREGRTPNSASVDETTSGPTLDSLLEVSMGRSLRCGRRESFRTCASLALPRAYPTISYGGRSSNGTKNSVQPNLRWQPLKVGGFSPLRIVVVIIIISSSAEAVNEPLWKKMLGIGEDRREQEPRRRRWRWPGDGRGFAVGKNRKSEVHTGRPPPCRCKDESRGSAWEAQGQATAVTMTTTMTTMTTTTRVGSTHGRRGG